MNASPEKFYKLSAAGNDFVVFDTRASHGAPIDRQQASNLAKRLCPRRTSVGADGLMLLGDPISPKNGAPAYDYSMIYVNGDGSPGATCGNGARALSWLAYTLGIWSQTARFTTDAGEYEANYVAPNRLRIRMSGGKLIEAGRAVSVDATQNPDEIGIVVKDGVAKCDFLNTGVEHAIFWCECDEATYRAADIDKLGRYVRYNSAFQPAGTNANFCLPVGEDSILIRTYERGVEAETLACGTGCVAASASFLRRKGLQKGSVKLEARAGDHLQADLAFDGDLIPEVLLAGPVRLVFEGRLIP